jgi:predicted kinase
VAPAALRHHYIAYRAFVRAKVACLRHLQGGPGAAADAASYTDLALAHLRAGAVRLVMVGGLPGTGKSTLAGALADRLGAVLLSTDRLRKELAGRDPLVPARAAYRAGIYTPAHTRACYAELAHRAGELLARGESVMLDASWHRAADRALVIEVAGRTHSDLVQLCCTLPAELAAARMAARARQPGTSDADPSIAAAMVHDADPWPAAVEISTAGPPGRALDAALAAVTQLPSA